MPNLFLTKEPNKWKKDSLFNKSSGKSGLSACRKLKLEPCLSHCTGINSKWIKNLNIRPKTLVQERAGNTLETTGIGKDFLSRTQATKRRDGQMTLHEIKKFCTTKEMVSKSKRPPQSGRKYLLATHQTRDS
jgi:hypothetical protein